MTTAAWLTPPQIARELGIRESKVALWISKGELIAVNVAESTAGRPRWRIRRSDLETFLLRRRSQAPAAPIRRRRRDDNVIHFFS